MRFYEAAICHCHPTLMGFKYQMTQCRHVVLILGTSNVAVSFDIATFSFSKVIMLFDNIVFRVCRICFSDKISHNILNQCLLGPFCVKVD